MAHGQPESDPVKWMLLVLVRGLIVVVGPCLMAPPGCAEVAEAPGRGSVEEPASQEEPEGEPEREYASLKIAPPPDGGMYLGQYEWLLGDIQTFEEAIGRKVALWSPYLSMDIERDDTSRPIFKPQNAELAWRAGNVVLVSAYQAYPNPKEETNPPGFTVDRLLRGEYDSDLKRLASQFRAFGKPMFFMTAREPNGLGADYFGGFGPNGDHSLAWAIENKEGFAQFEPSRFPNAHLYADLGDPNVCDGVERLVAAQRYYYDFFVRQEGLAFLTFDTMGWTALAIEREIEEVLNELPSEVDPVHARRLLESCHDFVKFYPGDAYVDWVSINWYLLNVFDRSDELQAIEALMERIRKVAPDKPVFIMELGFADGMKKDSHRASESIRIGLRKLIEQYPRINGFAMWSFHPAWKDYFPFDCLIRPHTKQAAAFREVLEAYPSSFHSCVYFSDGSKIPTCQP